jgi:hypothetical protein
MKKYLAILALLLIAFLFALVSYISRLEGYNKGYDQAIKDNCFTIYPKNWITFDTIPYNPKDTIVSVEIDKQYRYFKLSVKTE